VNLSRVDLKLQRGGCNVKSLQQRQWRRRGKLVAWFQGSAMDIRDQRILAAGVAPLQRAFDCQCSSQLPSKLAKSDTERNSFALVG